MGLQNLSVWFSSHRMGPDTLAQDNIRLTQTGASQVMSIHLHVNSPFLAPQDPTNANAAGEYLSLISSICSLADRGCDG